MTSTLEETLISVWRQTLVEDARTVTVEGELSSLAHQPIELA